MSVINEHRALQRVNVLLGAMERIREIACTLPDKQRNEILAEIYIAGNAALAIQPVKPTLIERMLGIVRTVKP